MIKCKKTLRKQYRNNEETLKKHDGNIVETLIDVHDKQWCLLNTVLIGHAC